MSLSNIKKMQSEKGFTIVELLIVIVVIGILAAIVIVAYNGVQNRAKSSDSAATANSLVKKMEAYNAEIGNYPATFSLITGAASSTSYYIAAGTYTLKATAIVSTDTTKTFNYFSCATPSGFGVSTWDVAGAAKKDYYFGGCTSSSAQTLITS